MDMAIRVSLVFPMSKRDEAVVIGNADRGLGIAIPDFIRELATHSELRRSNRETHLARCYARLGKASGPERLEVVTSSECWPKPNEERRRSTYIDK